MLLHRIHWYLGQVHQVAGGLVNATGEAVEDNRATLTELEQTLTSQRHAAAELAGCWRGGCRTSGRAWDGRHN